jgi:hypothetical protein
MIFALMFLMVIMRYGFGSVMRYMLIGCCLLYLIGHELNVHGPEIDAMHARDVAEENASATKSTNLRKLTP